MRRRAIAAALALPLLGASAAAGAGFSVYGQGARALGRGEAFVAQADDATAIFYNVGGLGFLDRPVTSYGVTFDWRRGRFTGDDPSPGVGADGKDRPGIVFPPHLYHTLPLGLRWRFGVGFNVPFGLKTAWKDGAPGWPGATLVQRANLRALDVTPSFGVRLGRRWGVGFGAIVRATRFELARLTPSTATTTGAFELLDLNLRSDFDVALGYQAGVLHKPARWLSWGASYRSAVAVGFAGDGKVEPVEREERRASTPLPFTSDLELPDRLSVGVAIRRPGGLVLELDAVRTGWSRFDGWSFHFPGEPERDETRLPGWRDTTAYHFGVEHPSSTGGVWRLGTFFDPTPSAPPAASTPSSPTPTAGA